MANYEDQISSAAEQVATVLGSIESLDLRDPSHLAPAPSLDLALVLHQGELLHQAELMIELGESDPADLEDLLSRAYEYTVIADAGRVALCVDTKVKLREVYEELKQKIKEWRKERAKLLKDIEGGDV